MKRFHALSGFVVLWVFGLAFVVGGSGVGAETPGAPEVAKEDFHVYLLIGQSNMAGRAEIGERGQEVIERGYLLDGEGQWEPASNPLNRHSSIRKELGMQRLGPGYSFALKILEEKVAGALGLVVNAQGGTKIGQWAKGAHFYDEALRRAREAQQSGTLKGILWHQGESDSNNEEYLEALVQLVGDLREDLGDPDLPFVAGEVAGERPVNGQIRQLPEALERTAVVSVEGLGTTDGTHFDHEGMWELGERYASEMLRLLAD